ncbi:MAG: hypothetical protein EOP81_06285 [Variovorax sp.]|nr:MAG: hypothetical protein EOP81_06285 [Variovorax sp.]
MRKAMAERITMIIPDESGGVEDHANLMVRHMDNARVLRFKDGLDVANDRVLLHMSGYGYARYGAPVHLLGWLRRQRPRMKRFGVFMHEAYATPTRITSSVFWVWRLQRYVASQLAKRSDFWISNTEVKFNWLMTQAGDLPHLLLPVYSNVGEATVLPAGKRRMLLVFGSEPVRAATWRDAGEALFRWTAKAGIEVHDIGSPLRDPGLLSMLQAHRVVQHGRLASEQIDALMNSASHGLLAYSPHDVAKSGVFAAYTAHGMVPILLSPNIGRYDGLVPGTHYLHGIPETDPTPADAERMSRAAFDWYQGHSIAASVDAVSRLLEAPGSQGTTSTMSSRDSARPASSTARSR